MYPVRFGKPIQTLGKRYRLLNLLGSGGMAEVWLARDEQLNRHVAIKLLKDGKVKAKTRDRFIKEAGQIARWQHPHILRVYDHTQTYQPADDTPTLLYIVMEYVSGGNLHERLTPGVPYAFEDALIIFRHICDAVQYAHSQGIIHRDIKPLNILFRQPRTGPEEAVLADFGLAVRIDATHHTFADGGTLAYMAPEQLGGHAVPASDIFALGVTLYELLTGFRPFARQIANLPAVVAGTEPPPEPPSQINSRLPLELDEPILRALHPNPSDRYQSASHFWNALEKALRHTDLATSLWLATRSESGQLSSPAPLVRRASRSPKTSSGRAVSPSPWRTSPAPASAPRTSTRSGSMHRTGQTATLPRRRLPFALAGAGFLLVILLAAFLLHTAGPHAQTRHLSATSSQQATVPATGTFPGQRAHGRFLVQNNSGSTITLSTTRLADASGIVMQITGPVDILPTSPQTPQYVSAIAVEVGASGNILPLDISETIPGQPLLHIKNTEAFTGGSDARPNDQVRQQDIDQAATSVQTALKTQLTRKLSQLLQSHEQALANTLQCQPSTTSNVKAGDQATNVTVTVTMMCTEDASST